MKRIFLLAILVLSVLTLSVAAQDTQTYYVKVSSAKVRAEANTRATVVVTLRRNAAVEVIEEVEGTRVSGSTVWYHVTVGTKEGYLHSSLVTTTVPATTATTSQAVSTPVPTQAIVTRGGASCNGATTCGQMVSCEQARACLAAGRSSLDRDNDGVPCESICPGG